jgi:acyl-CoA thioesterase-1
MNRRLLAWISLGLVACAPSGAGEASSAVRAQTVDSAAAASVELPSDAAPTGPRIVFLGTSLTAGLGLLRAEDTYVARVGELADSAGLPVRVVNAGVSGDTSADGVRRLAWVLGQGPVDILVVELGANDALRGQDPDATEANLLEIVRQARETYPDLRVVIAGMEAPPNLGEAYTTRFHRIFPDVARETHSALIPFILQDVAGIPALNQSDGIHPTPEGARIMAHTVWTTVGPLVRAWYAARTGATTHEAPADPGSTGASL